MTTPAPRAAPSPRPPRSAGRTVVLLVLAPVLLLGLVGLTLLVRDPSTPSAPDVRRIDRAVAEGCERPGAALAEGTGYALDGVVVEVQTPPAPGPSLVTVRVDEWFLGPPLGSVSVWVPLTLLDTLTPTPGTRVLLSGTGWGDGNGRLSAAGCGRSLPWDAVEAEAWRAALGPSGPPTPVGPVATYRDAGFRHAGPSGRADLDGVVVVEDGCLYVQDGRTRWLPVLPDADTAWGGDPARVTLDGLATDPGHRVRWAGRPASGSGSPAFGGADADDVRAPRVDPAGVPEGCDTTSPRFVVGQRAGAPESEVQALDEDDDVVRLVTAATRAAGLRPVSASGEAATDPTGSRSWRVLVGTQGAGDVLVHLETVSSGAWPQAYDTSDVRLRWSMDPRQAASLPVVPAGAQLAVLDGADGAVRVLWRTPVRALVSVGVEPGTALQEEPDEGVATLVSVAREVALSPGGASS